jgi:hypothetical protein
MLPDFFTAIGSDRCLTLGELEDVDRRCHSASETRAQIAAAWDVYQQSFDGFCETQLDPQFHHLNHPATHTGSLQLDAGDPVLVVGTGPSLTTQLPQLLRLRPQVRIFTSPRGAEVLAKHGIAPDLVLIEHRTALDAHHSARHGLDGTDDSLAGAALIAADRRTPASLIAHLDADRLFVPDPLPTWGAWPATLVAMAIDAGASRIGLLGIDLGTTERPDPAFAPLSALLSLLSTYARCDAPQAGRASPSRPALTAPHVKRTSQGRPAMTVDCGPTGARKNGWPVATLDDLTASRTLEPVTIGRRPALSIGERRTMAAVAMRRLAPAIERARRALEVAMCARAGAADAAALVAAAQDMLEWGRDRQLRIDIQETLGVSFLPRLWRSGIDIAGLDRAIWRPVLLAAHEMVGQADALRRHVDAVNRSPAAGAA